MNLFKRQQNNSEAVTELLVQNLKIKVTKTTIKQCLSDHPDYPSLVAISDCLAEWQIANEAMEGDKSAFTVIDCPFISQFNNGSFILITATNENEITYSNENKQKAVMPANEFLEKWNGTILRAEADEASGDPKYHQNKWNDWFQLAKIPLLITVLLLGINLAITATTTTLTLSYCLLFIINLLGVGVTSLLLVNSIDDNNHLVLNVCSYGSKNGCNTILKSNASKLTNWLSWSEVGFFYFMGSLLAMLFVLPSLPLLAWLNLFALPYTVYSIHYQYRHKNWCVLCCVVQALLILGSTNILIFNLGFISFTKLLPLNLYLTFFCFLFSIVAWYTLKPFFQQSVQFKSLKQQLEKFKYNRELFNQILKNQPRYTIGDEMMPVILGNPEAETIITMVSNPFCDPCAKAHQTIDEWLKYRDDLQLKIIFTTADHDNDEKTKMARHIGALSKFSDMALVESALNDWYTQPSKKYELWAKKYPISYDGEMSAITQKQKAWCEMAGITFTPTILVNGYKLPEPYRLEDIKYLIT